MSKTLDQRINRINIRKLNRNLHKGSKKFPFTETTPAPDILGMSSTNFYDAFEKYVNLNSINIGQCLSTIAMISLAYYVLNSSILNAKEIDISDNSLMIGPESADSLKSSTAEYLLLETMYVPSRVEFISLPKTFGEITTDLENYIFDSKQLKVKDRKFIISDNVNKYDGESEIVLLVTNKRGTKVLNHIPLYKKSEELKRLEKEKFVETERLPFETSGWSDGFYNAQLPVILGKTFDEKIKSIESFMPEMRGRLVKSLKHNYHDPENFVDIITYITEKSQGITIRRSFSRDENLIPKKANDLLCFEELFDKTYFSNVIQGALSLDNEFVKYAIDKGIELSKIENERKGFVYNNSAFHYLDWINKHCDDAKRMGLNTDFKFFKKLIDTDLEHVKNNGTGINHEIIYKIMEEDFLQSHVDWSGDDIFSRSSKTIIDSVDYDAFDKIVSLVSNLTQNTETEYNCNYHLNNTILRTYKTLENVSKESKLILFEEKLNTIGNMINILQERGEKQIYKVFESANNNGAEFNEKYISSLLDLHEYAGIVQLSRLQRNPDDYNLIDKIISNFKNPDANPEKEVAVVEMPREGKNTSLAGGGSFIDLVTSATAEDDFGREVFYNILENISESQKLFVYSIHNKNNLKTATKWTREITGRKISTWMPAGHASKDQMNFGYDMWTELENYYKMGEAKIITITTLEESVKENFIAEEIEDMYFTINDTLLMGDIYEDLDDNANVIYIGCEAAEGGSEEFNLVTQTAKYMPGIKVIGAEESFSGMQLIKDQNGTNRIIFYRDEKIGYKKPKTTFEAMQLNAYNKNLKTKRVPVNTISIRISK